eukprot:SM003495S13199  [mRNA]  locus=s3495:446:1211:+ [translate_table: standard]
MAITPVARLLLFTLLAATTLRAAARASVSGDVYCDNNRNGVIDGPDTILPGAKAFIASTGSNGKYLFSNELPTEQDSPALYYGCTIKLISSSNSNCQVIGPCDGGDVGIYVVDPNRKARDLCAC